MDNVYRDDMVCVTCGDWRELAEDLASTGCDALITDPPYSARTHERYDPGPGRRPLDYASWTADDVHAFVRAWSPITRGWMCVMTDDVLARSWIDALEDAGRYAYSPIACVVPGSRVRLRGDGPPQWSVWLIVSRPRDTQWARWATTDERNRRGARPLPGAYITPPGRRRRDESVVGGKPLSLLRQIVGDYSWRGSLVVDPCCGAGTTLLAARIEGRRAIGIDIDPRHAQIAARRLRRYPGIGHDGTLPLWRAERETALPEEG